MQRGLKILLLSLPIMLALLSATTAAAQMLSERTYKRLENIHELMGAEKYTEAEKQLRALEPSVQRNDYEKALVLQTYGYLYSSKDQYKRAADYFTQALDMNVLPEQAAHNMRYNLAQLQVAAGDYRNGIRNLEIWLSNEPDPIAQAHLLAGTAYAQVNNYAKGIPHVKSAIRKSEKPKESWYQLLLSMHYEQKDYRNSISVLEDMVSLWPDKKQYWQQLSGVNLQLERDDRALAALELAYKRGLLTESKELVNLANLYMFRDIPYTAARLLEKEINNGRIDSTDKNWELMADAWMRAQEVDKALVALERTAQMRSDPDLHIRRAQLFLETERWDEVIAAVDQAFAVGAPKKPGQARMLQGIGYFETGRYQQAIKALKEGAKDPGFAKQARQWIAHVNSEIAMKNAMADE